MMISLAAGEAGNAALDIYSVMQDPSSAIFVLFSHPGNAAGWVDAARSGEV